MLLKKRSKGQLSDCKFRRAPWMLALCLASMLGCASTPVMQQGRPHDDLLSGLARSQDPGSRTTVRSGNSNGETRGTQFQDSWLFGLSNRNRKSPQQNSRGIQNNPGRIAARPLPNNPPVDVRPQQSQIRTDPNIAQATYQEPAYSTQSAGNSLRSNGNQQFEIDPMAGIQQSSGHYDQGTSVRGQELQPDGVPATLVALQLGEEKAALQAELNRMKQINSDLASRLDSSNRDLSDANARISQMQSEMAKQLAKNDQLQNEVNGLNREKADLIEQSRMLVAAIEKTLDEILFNQLSASSAGGN